MFRSNRVKFFKGVGLLYFLWVNYGIKYSWGFYMIFGWWGKKFSYSFIVRFVFCVKFNLVLRKRKKKVSKFFCLVDLCS